MILQALEKSDDENWSTVEELQMGHKIKQYPKRNDGPSVIEGPSTDVLSATLNQSRISILKENRSISSQKSRRPSLNTSATKMELRSNPGGKTRTRKPKKKVEISLEMLNEEPKLLQQKPQDSGTFLIASDFF